MDIFGPARRITHANRNMMKAMCSIDLENNLDLHSAMDRQFVWNVLRVRKPKIVMSSAPCTFYSALNVMWNKKKRSLDQLMEDEAAADDLLDFSMAVAVHQHEHGICLLS